MDKVTDASEIGWHSEPPSGPEVVAVSGDVVYVGGGASYALEPTLTDFLLSRIAEDEAAFVDQDENLGMHLVTVEAHDRWLRECEAKRAIVEECQMLIDSFGDWDATPGARVMWTDVNRRERSQAHGRLHLLASIYADHPDYREEWRP